MKYILFSHQDNILGTRRYITGVNEDEILDTKHAKDACPIPLELADHVYDLITCEGCDCDGIQDMGLQRHEVEIERETESMSVFYSDDRLDFFFYGESVHSDTIGYLLSKYEDTKVAIFRPHEVTAKDKRYKQECGGYDRMLKTLNGEVEKVEEEKTVEQQLREKWALATYYHELTDSVGFDYTGKDNGFRSAKEVI